MTDEKRACADPASLGLAAFALTTFVLSVFNAGILPVEAEPVYIPLAWFYGGIVQILAGMWEFKNRNVFGATAFSSYGAFWVALGTYSYLATAGAAPLAESLGDASIGVFLVGWTVFTFYMWIASWRTTRALSLLFTLLLATFVLLDLSHMGVMSAQLGGAVGIATALVAWYISAAGVINEVWGEVVLPVWPYRASPTKGGRRAHALPE